MYYTGGVFQQTCTYYDMLIYMLWSGYRGKYQIALKKSFIQTYERMVVQMDDRATENIIFDQGVRKYVRVTLIMTFDQVYVTNHNYN